MSVKITEADLKAALPDLTTTMRFSGTPQARQRISGQVGHPSHQG